MPLANVFFGLQQSIDCLCISDRLCITLLRTMNPILSFYWLVDMYFFHSTLIRPTKSIQGNHVLHVNILHPTKDNLVTSTFPKPTLSQIGNTDHHQNGQDPTLAPPRAEQAKQLHNKTSKLLSHHGETKSSFHLLLFHGLQCLCFEQFSHLIWRFSSCHFLRNFPEKVFGQCHQYEWLEAVQHSTTERNFQNDLRTSWLFQPIWKY